jgi:hypothetical protein
VLEPSLVSVAPDVVALELAWVVADGNSVRRVWVVIVAVVFIVGKGNQARALCVTPDDGAQRWRGAFAGASAGDTKVRHSLGAGIGVG